MCIYMYMYIYAYRCFTQHVLYTYMYILCVIHDRVCNILYSV